MSLSFLDENDENYNLSDYDWHDRCIVLNVTQILNKLKEVINDKNVKIEKSDILSQKKAEKDIMKKQFINY